MYDASNPTYTFQIAGTASARRSSSRGHRRWHTALGRNEEEPMHDLLHMTAERAAQYLDGLGKRGVTPAPEALARLAELGGPLPDAPTDPADILALLDRVGSPATVASSGGRYYGFVVGGTLPASLAANWLAAAWDQNAATAVLSPVSAALEAITQGWLLDLLALPAQSGIGFVTGATMANLSALAAARRAVLER